MKKSKLWGMSLHQALSFSPLFLRVPRSEAVFWPGCALLTLDPSILSRTLGILERAEPGIRLAAGCCGQPTVHLFPEQAEKREQQLIQLLKRRGVRRIYTACPNCTLQLRQLEGFQVIPIWGILADHVTAADLQTPQGKFVWHAPCPIRTDDGQRQALQALLTVSGCDVVRPDSIRCCGNVGMLHITHPEKSAAVRKRRLEALDSDRIILSSCEGCLDAFRREGRETCHLLELLFGNSQSRGWHNRILNR